MMEIEPSNLICPKCLKGGYVNYIGQSYKYIAKCYNCGFYFEKGTFLKEVSEKKTNGDRIRNMTDEELADLLLSIQCSVCVFQGYCDDDETPNHSKICKNKILEWLKQEAET